MAKYKYKNEEAGYNSGYESDDGNVYNDTPNQSYLGKGASAYARKFENTDKSKQIVVLAAINELYEDSEKPKKEENKGIIQEFRKKKEILSKLNPHEKIELFEDNKKYKHRLRMELIKGQTYDKFDKKPTATELAKIIFTAIQTLKACHKKGIVIIDLKVDNIFYDEKTSRSHLIDGGLSEYKNAEINPKIFKKTNKSEVKQSRENSSHIAPECFDTKEVKAQPSMDIYSLGDMLENMLDGYVIIDKDLSLMAEECQKGDPKKRPSLQALEIELITKYPNILDEYLDNIEIEASNLNSQNQNFSDKEKNIIEKLSVKIKEKRSKFVAENKEPSQKIEKLNHFQNDCVDLIRKTDQELAYNKNWKPFRSNLLLAISCITIVPIPLAIYSLGQKLITGRYGLFDSKKKEHQPALDPLYHALKCGA